MPRAHVLPDGRQIFQLRGEADLTQADLARESGYGLRTIGKIEASQPTRACTLAAVATVLGRRLHRAIVLADLIRRDDIYPPPAPKAGHCVCTQVCLQAHDG
jgi:transcriptional regulator with XRE-family HTH domain